MARVTQAKIEKAVRAVAAACGGAQVVIEPDGTIRISPVDVAKAPAVDRKRPVEL